MRKKAGPSRYLFLKRGKIPFSSRMNNPNNNHSSTFNFYFQNSFLPIAVLSMIMICIYYFQSESADLNDLLNKFVHSYIIPNQNRYQQSLEFDELQNSIAITIENPFRRKRLIFGEVLELNSPPSPISLEENKSSSPSTFVFPPPEQFLNNDSFLFYERASDRCMVTDQWLQSLKCGILEASALGRIWVMDMRVCISTNLSSSPSSSSFNTYMKKKKKTEVYNDFRLYFNWKRFSNRARVIELGVFERELRRFNHIYPWRAILPRVAKPNTTTLMLKKWKQKFIKREFTGTQKPFWFQICENNSIIQSLQRPRGFLRFNDGLKSFADQIYAHLHQSYYALKVQGEIMPHFNQTQNQTAFSSQAGLLRFVQEKIPSNSKLFVSSTPPFPFLMSSLRSFYDVYVLGDFKHLWDNGTYWEQNVIENVGLKLSRIKFDGFMEFIVEQRVVALARKTLKVSLNVSNHKNH